MSVYDRLLESLGIEKGGLLAIAFSKTMCLISIKKFAYMSKHVPFLWLIHVQHCLYAVKCSCHIVRGQVG